MASNQLQVLRWYQTHPNIEAHFEDVARDIKDMDAKQVGSAAASLARKGVPGFCRTGQRGHEDRRVASRKGRPGA